MWSNLKSFIQAWLADDPFTQSGAIAYYAVFSMPGLLIIVMGIAALFFEQQQVEEQVLGHIEGVLGQKAAFNIENIVEQTQTGARDTWAMIVGATTLLFGATGLFLQLQRSLNRIWDVEIKKSASFVKFLKKRATTFGIILAIGFLLLVSLSITTALSLLGEWLSIQFSPVWARLISGFNVGLSFLTVTTLFALIFKILPDAQVQWRHAFYGGALSAFLFNIGEYVLTYYFDIARPQSAFGAAGAVVLLMIWMSYSSLILLLGAEFAKIYAEKETKHTVKPEAIAKKKLHGN